MSLFTVFIFAITAFAERKIQFDYDLNKDSNRWNLTKECAHTIHKSAVQYCSTVLNPSFNLRCDSPNSIHLIDAKPNSVYMTLWFPNKDFPRRSTFAYMNIKDIKACAFEIIDFPK